MIKELNGETNISLNKTGVFIKQIIQQQTERLSVSDIAKRSRIDRSYLHHALNGRKNLSLEQIVRVAEILKMSDSQTEFLIYLALYEQAENPKLKMMFMQKLQLWDASPQSS